jgi:multifunctional methyltransferase subunit TRM112
VTPSLHFSSKLTILTASPSRNLPGLILSMLNKIQWSALRSAASDLSLTELDAINEITEEVRQDDVILRKIHHILFEVHLVDGFLVCPETSRKFPVKDGIPNMLLHEDEV